MYCRVCGAEISDNAHYCDQCGAEVKQVKQRSYSEKYNDKKKEEKEKKKKESNSDEGLKNPYVNSALGTSLVAFALSVFPWPAAWNVGTSWWMKTIILIIALLSDYHCVKSRQMNNLYYKKYHYRVHPGIVRFSTILAVFITIIALFAMFNI